jgi:hypothetical protein
MRGLFFWMTVGGLIWGLAIYGAYSMFYPRQCELGIGALL